MSRSDSGKKPAHLRSVEMRHLDADWGASEKFNRARRRAAVQDLLAPLRRAPVDLLPFEEIRQKLRLDSGTYQGLRNVPLDHIVGSVERYLDFTRAFLPRKDALRQRWQGIVTLKGRVPPVKLYQVGDVYCVVDGHHRVSVARQGGALNIEAEVWQYQTRVPLDPETTFEELLIKEEYLEFLEHTRLDESRPQQYIELTSLGGYRELECQIASYQVVLSQIDERSFSVEEAAAYWYDMIYTPVLQIICQKDILEGFPGRTEADLFVWVSSHQQELSEVYGYTVSMTEATDNIKARYSIKWPRRAMLAIKERLLGPSRKRHSGCDT
jgi:hypothetical protein